MENPYLGGFAMISYEQWKELDSTFDLIIEIIMDINSGDEMRSLEEALIEIYKKEVQK